MVVTLVVDWERQLADRWVVMMVEWKVELKADPWVDQRVELWVECLVSL